MRSTANIMRNTFVNFNGREIDLEVAYNLADQEIMESLHLRYQTEQETFDAYLSAHEAKYGQKYAI